MRIKITRAQRGTVDGFSLSTFAAGQIYDVPPSLGSYLIAIGAADPLLDDVVANSTGGNTGPSPHQSQRAGNRHTALGSGPFSEDE